MWQTIETCLPAVQPVEGGYTLAHRGLLTLPTNDSIFVKIGLDAPTENWAAKEITAYRFLCERGFSCIPRLLATNSAETGFAVEALSCNEGWDWSNSWTTNRLAKTLAAMDSLAAIEPDGAYRDYFLLSGYDERLDGWRQLQACRASQQLLRRMLAESGQDDIVRSLDFNARNAESAKFVFKQDTLVHYDLRGDNCAWNSAREAVRFVDWSWLQMGDRRIDHAILFANVQRSGFDTRTDFSDRLDAAALMWQAGYWLGGCVRPVMEGMVDNADFRTFQFELGVTAYKLASAVSQI